MEIYAIETEIYTIETEFYTIGTGIYQFFSNRRRVAGTRLRFNFC